MCTNVLSTRCFILKLNFVNYQNVVLLVNIVGMESKNGRCVICIWVFFSVHEWNVIPADVIYKALRRVQVF